MLPFPRYGERGKGRGGGVAAAKTVGWTTRRVWECTGPYNTHWPRMDFYSLGYRVAVMLFHIKTKHNKKKKKATKTKK